MTDCVGNGVKPRLNGAVRLLPPSLPMFKMSLLLSSFQPNRAVGRGTPASRRIFWPHDQMTIGSSFCRLYGTHSLSALTRRSLPEPRMQCLIRLGSRMLTLRLRAMLCEKVRSSRTERGIFDKCCSCITDLDALAEVLDEHDDADRLAADQYVIALEQGIATDKKGKRLIGVS